MFSLQNIQDLFVQPWPTFVFSINVGIKKGLEVLSLQIPSVGNPVRSIKHYFNTLQGDNILKSYKQTRTERHLLWRTPSTTLFSCSGQEFLLVLLEDKFPWWLIHLWSMWSCRSRLNSPSTIDFVSLFTGLDHNFLLINWKTTDNMPVKYIDKCTIWSGHMTSKSYNSNQL